MKVYLLAMQDGKEPGKYFLHLEVSELRAREWARRTQKERNEWAAENPENSAGRVQVYTVEAEYISPESDEPVLENSITAMFKNVATW